MISPRTVLVTGASSGIGRASALLLAQQGFTVLAGVRRAADGDALRREGGEAIIPLIFDVTDRATVAAAVDEAAAAIDARGLDGLVNNAGIGLAAPLEYVPLDEVRRIFEVNLFGQLAVTQAFLPALRRARGRIVNIGSVGTHIAIPFGGVLNGTKSALASFNDALRLELYPSGVQVILIEPAAISTPAVEKTLGASDAVINALPTEGGARYGASLRAFMKRGYDMEKGGSPPEVVARTVLEALSAKAPRVRYLVGKNARLLRLAWLPRLVPQRLFDRLELRVLGLPGRQGAR